MKMRNCDIHAVMETLQQLFMYLFIKAYDVVAVEDLLAPVERRQRTSTGDDGRYCSHLSCLCDAQSVHIIAIFVNFPCICEHN